MKEISLLDCTLRDGGYINNWHFGREVIASMLKKLAASNVEFFECGYLSEIKGGDPDDTQFKDLDALAEVLPNLSRGQRCCVMIDYGQFEIDHIPEARDTDPIIRVCFHKKDREGALRYCTELARKGYTLFVQPMASLNYTDEEFIELIQAVNELNPACFYIVDSFGVVEIDDFQHLLTLADGNLAPGIRLGYHGHNNLQQAYGNAKYMVEQDLAHDIVIDASVYGMGRGAGNLNMELFASHLNKHYGKSYDVDAFLDIMDVYLKPIFAEHYWGYSLPFYLSARYNCHPNYAVYFSDKNTLSNKSMKQLLASLPSDVKIRFSVEEAEARYQAFQERHVDDADTLAVLREELAGRRVMILAPGRSIVDCREPLHRFIKTEHPVLIAINVFPDEYEPDYVFCSNEKRIKWLEGRDGFQLIVSSNIANVPRALTVNYSSYLASDGDIADNPTLMAIRLLIEMGVGEVSIAGFDGYSAVSEENYFDPNLALGTSVALKLRRNELVRRELAILSGYIDFNFLTESEYWK